MSSEFVRPHESVQESSSGRIPNNLKTSIYDVICYSLMVGMGETYLAAYALALGVPERNAGLVTIVPILIASFLQLISHLGIRAIGSRQRWVVMCALTQAMALLYLGAIGFVRPAFISWHLFAAASLYWTAALAAGPAWNSWITSIVQPNQRVRFFSVRTKYGQLATLMGLVCAGVILEAFRDYADRWLVFACLFWFAALCRVGSAYFLRSQRPKVKAAKSTIEDLSRPLADARLFQATTAVPTIWFMFLTQLAVQISGPFFTPYMLDELQLSYGSYMILLSAVFVGRFISAGLFERIVARRGIKALMLLGALGIIPLPAGWIVSDHFYYILALQFLAGIGWGAHELGFTLLLMDQLQEDERSRLLTVTNLFNSFGMLIGSSMGAWMLGKINPDQVDYHYIFAISTIARFLPLLLLPRMLAVPVRPRLVFLRTLGVRANGLNIIKPLVFPARTSTGRFRRHPKDQNNSAK
jgi:MFS family permease